jgi:ribosomal protein L12E/L44/L45/RPP1/RPP2
LLRAQQVVILGEGATWIGKLADEQFPGAVPIVDESHAREHVWDVARAAFALDIERRDSWAHRVIDLLSDGNVEEVIAAIETLPSLSPEPGKMKSVQETEAEYVRTNRQRMNSPVFRAQGMHLGSGIAEAACKTVVRTRATRSGMRWTPEGLAAILALRTAVLNKDFDQCWPECHKGAG